MPAERVVGRSLVLVYGDAGIEADFVSSALCSRNFSGLLDELADIGEPVNRVLEVDLIGEDVILSLYDLPSNA
jgi:hypothetical protein